MTKTQIRLECEECGEKYYLFLNCEKISILKEIDAFFRFDCINCGKELNKYFKKVD